MKAFIDFVGITFRAKSDDLKTIRLWVDDVVRLMFGDDVAMIDNGRGWSGYSTRLDLEGIGLVAFGGNDNTVHFEITGTGCARVTDWRDLADVVEQGEGRLTRVDVAADDLEGLRYSIGWCKRQYNDEQGFKPERGAHPKAELYDDMGSGKGCTFYVGSRQSGKLFRGYEKGKQLGDPDSPWFRVEVEYRAVHRELPLQMLTNPAPYLAGAYPCLADLSIEQNRPRTVAFESAAKIEKAIEHARLQCGRILHAMLALNGGDIAAAAARIHRPELPPRLAGVVRLLTNLRDSEETRTSCRPPDWMRDCTPAESIHLDRAYTLETHRWRIDHKAALPA